MILLPEISRFYGSMPPRISKIIAGWAVLHSRELEENWDDARDGRELTSIRGLK